MNVEVDNITKGIITWLEARGFTDLTQSFPILEQLGSLDVLELSDYIESNFALAGTMASATLSDLRTIGSLARFVAKAGR